MLWGLSEAQDLAEKYRKYNKQQCSDEPELNILLYGAGDIRHILQTLSGDFSNQTKLNFFIVDGCVDIVARNLLLLHIILSEDDAISLLGRTHLFMDFYGNSFVRPFSREFQKRFADLFIELSADVDAVPEKYSPTIDLSGLKYRERDQLGDIFALWRSRDAVNIKSQWNNQLRNYLGQRYDSRRGAFDWDLHMELRYRGGERICKQEYSDFRETGIAFQFPEYEYPFENQTLVVSQRDKSHGRTFQLVADMHTGPFPAFGLNCEDDNMLRSLHGESEYRSTDLTERNVLNILHRIRRKESPPYEQLRKHKLGSARFIPSNVLPTTSEEETVTKRSSNPGGLIELKNVKLNFLTISPEMVKRLPERYKNAFHVAFIGAGCFQYLQSNFVETVKDNGIVLFELLQLSLLPKEKRNSFTDEVKRFSAENGLHLLTNFNLNKHYTTYDYKKGGDRRIDGQGD